MLTEAQILNLYNCNNAAGCSTPGPTVTQQTPTHNDHTQGNSGNGTANFSYSVLAYEEASINCTLYMNASGQAPFVGAGPQEHTANGTYWFNSTPVNESLYTWNVECADANGANNASTNFTVVYDFSSPTVTVNANNFFSSANTTVLRIPTGGLGSLALNLTLADTYLFGHEILIQAPNGSYVFNWTRTNLSTSSETITNTTNLTGWPGGQYNVSVYVEDDHTAKAIPEYGVVSTQQSLEYHPPSGTVIRVESVEGNLNGVETTKLLDRYTFGFTWQNSRNEHQLVLSCDETLYYRGDLYEWPTFVCGEHWVDFVPTGMSTADFDDVIVKRLPSGAFNLNFKTVAKTDYLHFNSLGGLNSRMENYTFNLSAVPLQVENLSSNQTGIEWIELVWNETAGTTGSTLYAENGTALWNQSNGTTYYNVTGLSGGSTYRFWVLAWYNDSGSAVYNLSSSSENNITAQTQFNGSIAIEIRNELTNALLSGVNISVNLISDTNNVTSSTITGQVDISNITSENYTIRHTAQGWGLRDQYITILQNQTQDVVVYLINDSYRTGVVIDVRDTTGARVEGAVIKLLRYYGSTNTYNTVEMSTTTTEGKAVMGAEAYDAFYKWIVEYNGTTEYLSDTPENLFPQSTGLIYKSFTINIGGDYYESYLAGSGIASSVTYNNVTTTLSHIWNDPSGIVTHGCLKAEYASGASWIIIGPNCSAGAAGSVNLKLTDTATRTYKYVAFLKTNTDYSTLRTVIGWIDKARAFEFGAAGAFIYIGVILGGALLFTFSSIMVVLWTVLATIAGSILGFIPLGQAFIVGFATLTIGISIYLMRR